MAGEHPFTSLSRWLPVEPAHAADAAERVSRLEERYGISIPADFRQYLLEAAPAREAMDDEGTTWWDLDRIRNLLEEYEHDVSHPDIAAEASRYLIFADYLIWCWAWAVCCSDGPNRGRVALIGGAPDAFVADSFTEFAEGYLRDPVALAHRGVG